jgi:hypothetical protein
MTKRIWPFEDRQPVALIDLTLSSVAAGTVLWPPFLGVAQCLVCFSRFPRPFTAEVYLRVLVVLVATGAALGLLCGLTLVAGMYYRKGWVRRFGPYLVGAALVGLQSWQFPQLFAGLGTVEILWRSGETRVLGGVLLSLPAAWLAVRMTLNTAAVHTHHEHLRKVLPRELL